MLLYLRVVRQHYFMEYMVRMVDMDNASGNRRHMLTRAHALSVPRS